MPQPIIDFILTPHALLEVKRRGLDETLIQQVLTAPEQREMVRPGRDVLQSRFDMAGKLYLVRVFVDVDRSPAEVLTVYRTSRIEKYWRSEL